MRISSALLIALLTVTLLRGAEIHAVVPAGGPAPVGPYSPGIDTGDYLYVAGQGAESPDGKMPATFDGQVRQTLENVKAVVQAAGLTMDHIVYTQVYLADMQNFDRMNRVYAEFFPKTPPARATLGVAKLAGTPIEINAVAVHDLRNKKVVAVPGYDPREPVSAGILTHDRLFVSGMRGRDMSSGTVPTDPAAQVEAALDGMKAVVEAAGLTLRHMVFVNPYLTKQIPSRVMNKLYASRFEFGNTPARATIEVSSLPEGAQIEFTGVAVRDISQRRAIRPKNMPPSATASPCVFAGDTLYCSAKNGFVPGPNEGIYAGTVETQVRQSARNLLDNLEEAEMDFGDVVAANVYLDDIADFQTMNKIYAKYFKAPYPARTTIQQVAPVVDRKADEEGRYPGLEQISLIAVKGARGTQPASLPLPSHVPPKRSSQVHAGFGINSDLPREPYLPWRAWWWTRLFDAGVSWIRIGQYENSSDPTSWDWVEQKRGVYAIAPEVDDYVNSLVENGVNIQVQLMYGNPMYTSRSGKLPDQITPEPGSFHNDDRSLNSIFWAPTTPGQIEAFVQYATWMVRHFQGRIHYYALWNEQDIGYWNLGTPEEYGRLLKAVAPAIHQADPQAKVIYGGQAEPSSEWAKRALDACQCAAEIDVFAYHTYPGYGQNLNPETMDYGAYGMESPAKLRETVRSYPGIRKDIEFWDDEFNSIPSWIGSDETVQTKYVPRGMLYNLASGVRTFVWLLAAGVDGNEYDDFGLIHGKRDQPDDFTPRPVYYAIQNTNALFSDTTLDPAIEVSASEIPVVEEQEKAPFLKYGFRNANGKAIVAYWIAAHSVPGGAFPPLAVDLKLTNSGIQRPVLIDVDSGAITPLHWKAGTGDTLQAVPLRDSIQAIADASYFDWPVLPEAPSGLTARRGSGGIELHWSAHGNSPRFAIERRAGNEGPWTRIPVSAAAEFLDHEAPRAAVVCYRVRALNEAGESAYSNVVRVTQ